MDANLHEKVVCFGDARQAALFFDSVLPITLNEIVPASVGRYGVRELSAHEEAKADKVFSGLVRSNSKKVYLTLAEKLKTIHALRESANIIDLPFSDFVGKRYKENEMLMGISLRQYLLPIINGLGFEGAPILLPESHFSATGSGDDDSLSVYNLPLVDTGLTPWKQIMEIRRDEEKHMKLRNLRLFFYKNFHGKSRYYIEEELQKLIEEYKSALQEHGFETKNGSLSMLFSKDSIVTFGLASLIAVLVEGASMTALGAGALLNVGNIVLYRQKRKYELEKLKRTHPIAYLTEIRERRT